MLLNESGVEFNKFLDLLFYILVVYYPTLHRSPVMGKNLHVRVYEVYTESTSCYSETYNVRHEWVCMAGSAC